MRLAPLHRTAAAVGPCGPAVRLGLQTLPRGGPAVVGRPLSVAGSLPARDAVADRCLVARAAATLPGHPHGLELERSAIARLSLPVPRRGGVVAQVRDQVPPASVVVADVTGAVASPGSLVPVLTDPVAPGAGLVAQVSRVVAPLCRVVAPPADPVAFGG